MAGKAMPLCADCDFYKPPHEVDRKVHERSGVIPAGFCQRYPQALPKRPSDWCGEFKAETD